MRPCLKLPKTKILSKQNRAPSQAGPWRGGSLLLARPGVGTHPSAVPLSGTLIRRMQGSPEAQTESEGWHWLPLEYDTRRWARVPLFPPMVISPPGWPHCQDSHCCNEDAAASWYPTWLPGHRRACDRHYRVQLVLDFLLFQKTSHSVTFPKHTGPPATLQGPSAWPLPFEDATSKKSQSVSLLPLFCGDSVQT